MRSMEHSITKSKDRKLSVYLGASSIAGIQIIEEIAFLKHGYKKRTWQNDNVIVSRDELRKICKAAGIAVALEVQS